MAKYRYAGPGPHEQDGQLVRPGDERDFADEPDWGPWELIEEPQAAEKPPGRPATPPPTPPAAGTPAASTTPPATQNGM